MYGYYIKEGIVISSYHNLPTDNYMYIASCVYQFYSPIKSHGHMRPCIQKYYNTCISCKFVENVIIKEGGSMLYE